MQNANDDMDALMRKAGIDYPLFTGSADWSKVASALEIKEEPPMPKKNYGKYLGLILVFLVPFLFTQFDNDIKNEFDQRAAVTPIADNETVSLIGDDEKMGTDHNTTTQKNKQKVLPVEIHANKASLENTRTSKSRKNDLVISTSHSRFPSTPAGDLSKKEVEKQAGHNENHANQLQNSKAASITQVIEESNQTGNKQVSDPAKQTIGIESSEKIMPVSGGLKETPGDTGNDSLNSVKLNEPVAEQKIPTISVGPRKKFYIGVMGGINLTTIKMQEVKEAGTDIGIIAGYQFMKRWSIEAGVLSSSKYYYSDGKYLDNPKIYLPPNAKINTIEGDCRMIEIPILVKYDFGFKKAHNWFATAGVSSFLMKKEDYAYEYYYLNTGSTYLYEHSYKNESENWAAVMQLSAGYIRTLPWSLNLRMEPFIQIPLKGAGYGKLPLTSAGLRFSVTRSLF